MAIMVDSTISSEELERNAEIRRLARLLGVVPDELDYLTPLAPPELRALRGQVTASLFDARGVLARMAAASRILPAGLVVTLAERVFGPMLAARIAGLLEVDRAVDIAARLPVPFLADVATELDPRRVADILGAIPPATIAAVAAELIAREEWIAMGTFYAYLPPASVRAAIGVADAPALLQIALVLEDKERLSVVLEIAGTDTLSRIAVAAEAAGLSAQLRALEVYLTPEQRAQLPA
ncbi:MAG TPA: hypothetical protein VFN48_05635 [Solirubrobacteraceae bacterium]|nr:hypothetical protein [Solirubrobacteraceae bacterium]